MNEILGAVGVMVWHFLYHPKKPLSWSVFRFRSSQAGKLTAASCHEVESYTSYTRASNAVTF